ncbi:nitronate monooxygenase [Rariglobus hedericola]|uniref:Nitronate monooxygenase n=1 Tax=Rariglobus hedericola TaxID=2597822 RepID=A0A556QR55_9BACT|nr:nitronate monooxygenase [Rariglobus hedericola]TSJ79125.1 nitronate monooxygenase [Rariglobus hedericola]
MSLPIIIQGGMGVGVSNWKLALAVSRQGQLGVVSGTLLTVVLARRLQQGDPGGELRRALANFPFPEMAERVLAAWFVEGGKAADRPFKSVEMPTYTATAAFIELTVIANFVEVFLSKEGHTGVVGINLLEKIQLPTLPSLFGAMLAGVDYVLMGAGIPRTIPGVLDQFAAGEAAEIKIDVSDAAGANEPVLRFDPVTFCGGTAPALKRPRFLAIISSATLATTLARKSTGRVDGFIVEGESAGGHNAPPRGALQLTAQGEPIYGPRDTADLEKIRALGLPFWLAGAHATPGQLAAALAQGATGVQIGTAFAFCEESGIMTALKKQVLSFSFRGTTHLHTDPFASPTGFPFKVLQHSDTLSNTTRYAGRPRVCDLGYLREAFAKPDGTIGYRCGAEPLGNYFRKGGEASSAVGRKCLCNGLLATVGLGQIQGNYREPALITAGADVAHISRYVPAGETLYRAADVLNTVLSRQTQKVLESVTEPK